jgi:predicted alpha/beta hydrolase family esterase
VSAFISWTPVVSVRITGPEKEVSIVAESVSELLFPHAARAVTKKIIEIFFIAIFKKTLKIRPRTGGKKEGHSYEEEWP